MIKTDKLNFLPSVCCIFLVFVMLTGFGSVGVHASTYEMDFPVKLNDIEVAQLTVAVDGMSFHSVVAAELKANLHRVLSARVNLWLADQQNNELSLVQLQAKGIDLQLQAQDLTLKLILSESAMAVDSLNYTQERGVVMPTHSGRWSLLNNFNLSHQRTNSNANDESSFEWLFDGNVGGGSGVNFSGSGFWLRGINHQSEFYRGDFSLFYDEANIPRRLRFGDNQNPVIGHLSSYQVGGLSVSTDYPSLQPQRNLTPGNSQVFVLSRAAEVEVFVNGFLVSRIRLRAGRYDIKDLPLTSGSNSIRLVAQYNDGEIERFNFSTHYNAQLLAQGISNYHFMIGMPSTIDNRVYHYASKPMISGSFEQGWSDALTLGINGVAHQDGQMLGLSATTGQGWGNTSWRLSYSHHDVGDGYGATFESEHNVFGQSLYGAPNLRLGFETKHQLVATPWLVDVLSQAPSYDRYYFDYSYYLSDAFDISVFGNVQQNKGIARENFRSEDFTAQLNWRYDGLNVSTGVRYQKGQNVAFEEDKRQWFLNFTWNFYHLKQNSRSRLRYNSRTKIASASYTRVNSNFLNDYGYQLLAEKGDDFRREQVRGSYTGNWVRADVNVDNLSRDEQQALSSLNLNLATSLGVVDGRIGLGTNISTPFALVEKHPTLKDSEVLLNVDRRGRAQSESTNKLGALVNLGSPYSLAVFNVEVADAPFGYDWGPGTYQLAGGANTGHRYVVGSDSSYTVLGVLMTSDGKAISLKRGQLVLLSATQAKSINVFTNRVGRFVVEGVGVGRYQVQVGDLLGEFEITESEQRFVRLDSITLLEK